MPICLCSLPSDYQRGSLNDVLPCLKCPYLNRCLVVGVRPSSQRDEMRQLHPAHFSSCFLASFVSTIFAIRLRGRRLEWKGLYNLGSILPFPFCLCLIPLLFFWDHAPCLETTSFMHHLPDNKFPVCDSTGIYWSIYSSLKGSTKALYLLLRKWQQRWLSLQQEQSRMPTSDGGNLTMHSR